MTFEEAENAHNDINQWWAARDFGIHSPSRLQSPLADTNIEQQEGGHAQVCVSVCIDEYVLCRCIFAFMYRNVSWGCLILTASLFANILSPVDAN